MAFNHVETVPGTGGVGSDSATLTTPASEGNFLLGYVSQYSDELESNLTVTSGFLPAGVVEVASRFIAIYYKQASGGEDTFSATSVDNTEDITVAMSAYTVDGTVTLGEAITSTATNAASITVGPVATTVGSLLIALFRGGSTSDNTGGFTRRSPAAGYANSNVSIWPADKIATGTSESATHTLTEQTLRQSAVLVSFSESSGGPTPTISNVDGDNAVNQGQLVDINVADFTESITSGDIGGVAFPSIPDNDPADDLIQVRMPVTLAAGTYDVTISGATETDTISGVTYAITHQYTAPYAPVDSNSLFAGQSLTEDSYFRIVTPPANGTIDAATAEANSLWGNDVDDIYTPDNGFTGDDTVTLEILYADGTTAQWTATISVTESDTVGPVIVSVSVPTTGTYAPGDALNFTVNFDENTFRTGVPALNLDVGGSTRQANYVSGTDTTALVFRYIVQEGDEDTDGITVSSLTLDGGTLKDSAGNDATLTLSGVGDTSGILIDGVSPTISIGAINTMDTTPTASGSAGDSDSLTLDLNGVDVTHTSSYNIIPSGGSWSQQFPELAIGTYTMTLTGVDTVGNETVETATLQIVEPSTSPSSKLLRQLLRGSLRSSLKLS